MANLQLTLIDGGTQEQRRVFDVSSIGGTIGRSKDCDWILHDTDRFISNKHFMISYRDDQFYLTDLSSNGVFVNGSSNPVGKGNTYTIVQSDIITLGKFRILVSSINIGGHSANTSQIPSSSMSQQAQSDEQGLLDIINSPSSNSVPILDSPSASVASVSSEQPSDLGLFDILNGTLESANHVHQPSGSSNLIPDDWDLSSPNQDVLETPTFDIEEKPVSVPELETEKVAEEVAPQPRVSNAPSSAFFDYLYDNLNLPAEYKKNLDQTAFADDLVNILTTSTQGIMALIAGRSVFKQESRLNMTMIKPQSNNPIKFSLDPSDTLEMLLVKKRPGYLSAQAAYSEALNDIQAHQMAFISGLQATLKGLMEELTPDTIEEQAAKQPKSFIGLNKNIAKWNAFVSKQEALQKQIDENLNDILSSYFSPAYEQHIHSTTQNNGE